MPERQQGCRPLPRQLHAPPARETPARVLPPPWQLQSPPDAPFAQPPALERVRAEVAGDEQAGYEAERVLAHDDAARRCETLESRRDVDRVAQGERLLNEPGLNLTEQEKEAVRMAMAIIRRE